MRKALRLTFEVKDNAMPETVSGIERWANSDDRRYINAYRFDGTVYTVKRDRVMFMHEHEYWEEETDEL